jgi:transposase
MAQMMRAGLYRPVHVKTLRSQKLCILLTHRKLLQSKAIAVENDLRGTLRNFDLKVGIVGKLKFEARIKELVESHPDLAILPAMGQKQTFAQFCLAFIFVLKFSSKDPTYIKLARQVALK